MKIKTKIEKLMLKQNQIQQQITELQNQCPHENINLTPKASSGYAEETEYFYSVVCADCGIRDFIEQDEFKNKYPNSETKTWCKYTEKWK